MARHDYLGATSPIEGSRGYFALYAGDGADAGRALDGLGSDFEVMNTAVKPYPCCRYSHATIDAVADIVRAESLASPDIDGIEIAMGETGYGLVADPAEMKRVPSNVVEGQFSVYFAAAATAGKGAYAWDAYDRLDDAEVRRLMQRTSVTLDARFGSGMESIVSLRTADGRTIERTVAVPQGRAGEPHDVGRDAGEVHRVERARHRRGARGTGHRERRLARVPRLDERTHRQPRRIGTQPP